MDRYFEFTKAEQEYLEGVNRDADAALSPYATKNGDAIQPRPPRMAILRPPFSYDTDLILHSPLYNRYADKTQVFSFYRNDDITRRALHVQLVSKIARSIGRALRLNTDLIEAAALGHDIGHTPFGHKGEAYLSKLYETGCTEDGREARYFNHNVHSARIFRVILGSDMTLQTLSGIISHNGEKVCREYLPSTLRTFEEFDDILEHCYTDNAFHKTLRPSTLEGCVVRISDMIAYAGKDRQDLYRAGLVPQKRFEQNRLLGTKNRDIISGLTANIVKNSIKSPSLNMDEEVFEDLKALIDENYDIIYRHPELNKPYEEVIEPLMKGLYARLKDDIRSGRTESPVFRYYLNDRFQGRCYKNADTGEITADANDIVTDFIASMTDDYFIDICRHLHINDEALGKLHYHEYEF